MALSNTTDPQRAARSLAEWWEKTHPGEQGVVVTDLHMQHSAGMSSETILFGRLGRTPTDRRTSRSWRRASSCPAVRSSRLRTCAAKPG